MGAPSEFTDAFVIECTESIEFVELDGETYENVFHVFNFKVGGKDGLTLASQTYFDRSAEDPNAPRDMHYSIVYDGEAVDLDHARQLFYTFLYSRMSKVFNNSMGRRNR
jgi:hypothetical protein